MRWNTKHIFALLFALLVCTGTLSMPVYAVGTENETAAEDQEKSPVIVTQPVDYIGKSGERAVFSIEVAGAGLTYQWEYSKDNGVTWNISSSTSKSVGCAVSSVSHGWLYHCIVTDTNGHSVISDVARVIMESELEIITQPMDYKGKSGSMAEFTVTAAGVGLSYQWEYSKDKGETWITSSSTNSTVRCAISSASNGWLYHCIVKDAIGTCITTDIAQVVMTDLMVATQPKDYYGKIGERAAFSVKAAGEGLTYQWEYSKDGGENWLASSGKTSTVTCAITSSTVGRLYRCVITDADGETVTSHSASIKVTDLIIITQPEDYKGKSGGKAVFTVEASGIGLTYQWEYSRDGGESWLASSCKTAVATCALSKTTDGRLYRCIITDDAGNSVTTISAKIILTDLMIVTQPEDYYGKIGERAPFSVKAAGEGLTYQWEYSKDGGENWLASSGKTSTVTCAITSSTVGRLYRCVITDADGETVTSHSASIKVTDLIIITQPEDYKGKSGGKAVFTVEASGIGLTYQWEYSRDGGESWLASSCKTAVATCALSKTTDGRLYRCIITDDAGNSVTTMSAKIILTDLMIVTQPENYVGPVGNEAVFTVYALGDGLLYQWEKYDIDTNEWEIYKEYEASANTLTIKVTEQNNDEKYRCIIKDYSGEKILSDEVVITVVIEGFEEIEGNIFYRLSDGTFAKGLKSINNNLYYFGTSGIMQYGLQTIEGLKYYFDPDCGKALFGFQSPDNGSVYYFLPTGDIQKGLSWIDGKLYYFGVNYGNVITGWHVIENNRYYFDPETYEARIGFQDIDGLKYYFDANGICYCNGFYEIDNEYYYFRTYGSIVKGFVTVDDTKYYCDEETGVLITGYYLDLATNCYYYYDGINGQLQGWKIMVDGTHYFYSNGVMARGVTTIDSKKYYFNWNTGIQETGLIDIGMGHYMYFDEYGENITGLQNIGDTTYYFNSITGMSASGFLTIGEKTYYFDPKTYQMVTGFRNINGYTYYFDNEGKMLCGFFEDNNNYYYTNANGRLRTGAFTLNEKSYYADTDTGALYTGFFSIGSGNTCYYDGLNGRLTGLQNIDGNLYYFANSGIMLKGIQTIDEKRYYFDQNTGMSVTGLVEDGGNLYYFTENGVADGLYTVDGMLYYFSNNGGYACSGWQIIDGRTYYFDVFTHQAKIGWQTIGGTTYYFDDAHVMLTDGIYEIDNEKYYFYTLGTMAKGLVKLDSGSYYFDLNTGKMQTGFIVANGYTYYFTEEGALTGLQRIDNDLYYFNVNGVMQTGFKLITVNNVAERYYFDQATGKAVTGFINSSGNYYYFEDGLSSKTGICTIDGVTYYFSPTYTTAYVAGKKTVDNIAYYFDSTGANRCGFLTYNDTQYYFLPGGGYATTAQKTEILEAMKEAEDGFQQFYGVTYYKLNGNFLTGFQKIDDKIYYFAEDNGEMLTGLRLINGNYYFFDQSGIMQTGAVELERGITYFASTGEMLQGFVNGVYYTVCGSRETGFVYSDSELSMSEENVLNGFMEISGSTYYFVNNKAVTGLYKIKNDIYYFAANGIMQTGTISIDNVKMYFNPENGKKMVGFIKDNDQTYYFDADAGMLSGMQTIEGKTYYFDGNGIMRVGIIVVDSERYYFDPATGCMRYGLFETNGKRMYADPSTGVLKSGFITINGKEYYFKASSYTGQTGWLELEGVDYYFDNDGIRQTGFVVINGYTYYITETGRSKGLVTIGNDTYYFTEDGIMYTGIINIGEVTYSFDTETGIMQEGLVKIGDYYYGFLREGGFATGLVTFSDGRTFYFNETSNRAVFGLQSFKDGTLYYFDQEEGLLKNKTWESNGVYFQANENGYVSVIEDQNNPLSKMIAEGFKYLGTDYGNADNQLVCSSFVAAVLDVVDIDVHALAYVQYALFKDNPDYKKAYDLSELKPGDVVFYINGDCREGENCNAVNEVHHVGIYIGDGKMMEATSLYTDEDTGEKIGYTLVRDLVNIDDLSIVMLVHIL